LQISGDQLKQTNFEINQSSGQMVGSMPVVVVPPPAIQNQNFAGYSHA
jgi:hypothetical protein